MYKALCARCEHRARATEEAKYEGPVPTCKDLRVCLLSCQYWEPQRPIAVVRRGRNTHRPAYQASAEPTLDAEAQERYFFLATVQVLGQSVRMWLPSKWHQKIQRERREIRVGRHKPKVDRRRKEWRNVPITELLERGLV